MAKRSSSASTIKQRAWVPKRFEVQIGQSTYILEAAPINQVQQFDDMLSHIGSDVLGFSDRYYIVNGTGEREGPFSYEDAQSQLEDRGDDAKIESDDFDISTILGALVEIPYHLLKIMIPELSEEDCKDLTYPELTFLIDLLIEINGLRWFQAVAKNLGEPLIQQLGEAAADLLRAVSLRSSLETTKNTGMDSTELLLT